MEEGPKNLTQLDQEIQTSERIAEHIERKGLHCLLECTLDPMRTDEFGGGACLYVAYVSLIAHEKTGQIMFDVLHPADDRDVCPTGEPIGFSVPWDFEPRKTAQQVRRLAARASALYQAFGIDCEPATTLSDAKREISRSPLFV